MALIRLQMVAEGSTSQMLILLKYQMNIPRVCRLEKMVVELSQLQINNYT